MAGIVKGQSPNGKTGGRGGSSLPDSGDTIDAMMGGSGNGGSGSGGSGGKGGKVTIIRCCTSGDAPSCKLFCEGTHILLPLPVKIQSSTGANWNNVDSGSNFISKSLSGMWNDQTAKSSASTAMNGIMQTALKHKMNMGMVLTGMESAEFLQAKLGIAALPSKELSFDGVDFRKFNFTWKLVPLDENDSKQIHKFIKHAQRHMLPETSAGIVGYPDLWAVNWKPDDQGLPIVKDSYISQLDVDYSAAGQYTFVHKKNEPVAFMITISLIEATIFSRGDVDADIYG